MPKTPPSETGRSSRSDADRSADHAAIDRLSAELLPSLIAKLGATGLGELEVREGDWRVRLRRPAHSTGGPSAGGTTSGRDRRPSERGDRHGERTGRIAHEPVAEGIDTSGSRRVATSPAVGIFRPRSGLAVGDRVREGDRLGAVDMLGVPQDVVAPVDGMVSASLVEPGDAVEYGQELLVIEGAPTAALPPGTDG